MKKEMFNILVTIMFVLSLSIFDVEKVEAATGENVVIQHWQRLGFQDVLTNTLIGMEVFQDFLVKGMNMLGAMRLYRGVPIGQEREISFLDNLDVQRVWNGLIIGDNFD